MAELTIRLFRDCDSGQLRVRIGFASDEDASPQEHEQLHRGFVRRLLPELPLDAPAEGQPESSANDRRRSRSWAEARLELPARSGRD